LAAPCGDRAWLMRWAVRKLVETAAVIAAFSIAAVMLVMAYEVFCRYVLGSPTDWALEISTYLFAVSVTLGGAYTLRHHDHVGMELVYTMFGPGTRRIVQYISMFTILIFSFILFWYGIHEVRTALLFDERSLTPLAMPLAYPLSLVPIGGFLLFIQGLDNLFPPSIEVREHGTEIFE
jgi:TRAP-type C4-dicarboxylate transport system permease small subunit